MAERIIKWVGFSIGLTLVPVLLSVILRFAIHLNVDFNDYTSELLFMAVTLSATTLGDIYDLSKKGVKGWHLTLFLIVLIMIIVVCTGVYMVHTGSGSIYEEIQRRVQNIDLQDIDYIFSFLKVESTIVNVCTIFGCVSSLGIGVACQVFLEKIESNGGGNP